MHDRVRAHQSATGMATHVRRSRVFSISKCTRLTKIPKRKGASHSFIMLMLNNRFAFPYLHDLPQALLSSRSLSNYSNGRS